MRRAGRLLVAVCAGVSALVAPTSHADALARPCAAGQTHVTIIVDHGDSSAPSAVCVAAGSTDNGATVLSTRASMLGLPQPRFDASGLLCAIDGVPAQGCGEHAGTHYSYWAYFHGVNGSWSYANIGPAGERVSSGVVEGWRWEPDGSGLPTDPPPRAPASTAPCAPPPSPPPLPPAASQITTGGATTPPTNRPARSTAASEPGTRPSVATPRTTVAATPRIPRTETAATSSTTLPPSPERALAARATAQRSHDGAPVGLVVGVVLVVALAAGGGLAARRRNRPAT
ncbi:MAG TPA: hypothetical protein VEZ15_17345 [Acidimicrobiia bacterium]|nr:hypothetical protein [Acidimicrobiia bacterium]